MALDCAEVRVGITGHLYSAPVGTPMPTDVTTPLPEPWAELGYTSEDGVSLSSDADREDFNVWQSVHPCRSVVTGQTFTSTFTLVQRNSDTLAVAFGGGEVVVEGDVATYTPPPTGLTELAFVYEVIDGDIIDRYLMYRGSPSLGGEINFQRGEMTGYEIEVTHLNTADGIWRLVSNDPALLGGVEGAGLMAMVGPETGTGEAPFQTFAQADAEAAGTEATVPEGPSEDEGQA